ncbi:hypothetical protein [Desulfonatronospira sp.]|uniref:hypothetical protein n=1 Tax=Desulfonatronospira sp. TaxID=1962951 RepID=UPI0025BA6CA6|nr:hypothetical protein [Desulfonatronospira sp.]
MLKVLLHVLFMLLLFLILAGVIGAVGTGFGLFFNLLIPGIQLGHALISGMMVGIFSMYIFLRLFILANTGDSQNDNEDQEPAIVYIPSEFTTFHLSRKKSRKEKTINPPK